MVEFLMQEAGRSYDATALIFNTFDALEMEVLDALKSQLPLPPIYTVGPLHLLLNQIPLSESQSLGSNLWIEDTKCLEWLDSKKPNSVVYVNFGSITVMTPQQLVEFAWGLANSKHNFLWIIRPDLVVGESATLPPGFAEKIKERGLLANWYPQEDVLNHASIGGFLTHCGWNSILESLSCGIPMICWPFFADQQINCRYLCKHWEVGMEIDNNVKRDEVERSVRELMEGEKGKINMKERAMEWKLKAEEATLPGGSSYVTIDKIVSEMFGSKTT
ncbi:7-deoxyloganetin glucosyltransferase-like [Papaver somniferum]|uniref:7-deoxyloganetin glucosyltransferase-like n=1 Tax=Papaver somniferum TaxID=3469 RepID=UPI000E6F6646|nr:7-deoxyloganetin glucosyltransferase-like [Papaver somniferum]